MTSEEEKRKDIDISLDQLMQTLQKIFLVASYLFVPLFNFFSLSA